MDPRPRPRGALARAVPLGEPAAEFCICSIRLFSVRGCGASGTGDGAFSLIGLTAPGLGLRGDGCRTEPGESMFFHRVEEAEVVIGVGFEGHCLPDAVDTGVC